MKIYHITVLIVLVLPFAYHYGDKRNVHYGLFAPLLAIPFFIPRVHEGDMGYHSFTKDVQCGSKRV